MLSLALHVLVPDPGHRLRPEFDTRWGSGEVAPAYSGVSGRLAAM
jgi:hypothetical protein